MLTLFPSGDGRDWVQLLRVDKPVGYYLLLWPTLWGLLAASHGQPSLKNTIIFIIGVILMRSAGCIINDVADRHIDRHVARTRNRPVAAGRIAPGAAMIGFFVILFIALMMVLSTSVLVIQLAIVGALLAIIYPFMKRLIHIPQAWLGIAFGWGCIMAWAAETGSISHSVVPWLLFLANVCWSLSYDTAYAIGDREDDRRINVKSAALWLGKYVILAIMILAVMMLCFLLLAAWMQGGGAWLGWGLAACWQLYLCMQLIRHGETWGFRFFMLSHWSGAWMCVGLLL